MRKSIQKWAYALVTCAFALALCVSFSACSSDDDSKGLSPFFSVNLMDTIRFSTHWD